MKSHEIPQNLLKNTDVSHLGNSSFFLFSVVKIFYHSYILNIIMKIGNCRKYISIKMSIFLYFHNILFERKLVLYRTFDWTEVTISVGTISVEPRFINNLSHKIGVWVTIRLFYRSEMTISLSLLAINKSGDRAFLFYRSLGWTHT